MTWKKAGIGLLAGLVGGLVLGIGGRLAMALIAVAAGRAPAFSLGGSAEVLLTGIAIGAPAGVVFIAARQYLSRLGRWKGALFGALVFVLLVLVPPPAARSAAAGVGQLPLTLGLFGALFMVHGMVVEAVIKRREGV